VCGSVSGRTRKCVILSGGGNRIESIDNPIELCANITRICFRVPGVLLRAKKGVTLRREPFTHGVTMLHETKQTNSNKILRGVTRFFTWQYRGIAYYWVVVETRYSPFVVIITA
jgi:hypothetical protein